MSTPDTTETSAVPPAARAAARWWADQLRGVPSFNNGDSSRQGAMTTIMATLCAPKTPPTKADAFEVALATVIAHEMQQGQVGLYVDYGACEMFSRAADTADVNIRMALPWKTQMYVEKDLVPVAEGYGAPLVTIYSGPTSEGGTTDGE